MTSSEQGLEPQEAMSEYVPTTGSIRDAYCHVQQEVLDERGDSAHERFHAEFDRWLAAHERKIAAEAWDEGWGFGYTDRHSGRNVDGYIEIDPTPNPYRNGDK